MKKFNKESLASYYDLEETLNILLDVIENGSWKNDYYFASDNGSKVCFNKKTWDFLLKNGGKTLQEQLAFGRKIVIEMISSKTANQELFPSDRNNEWQSYCVVLINHDLGMYLKFTLNCDHVPVIDIHISDRN